MPGLAREEAADAETAGLALHLRRGPRGVEVEAHATSPRSATRSAAELYGLEVLATDIEDHPENETRFVLVGRGVPAPTGHDKTSIVCFQRQDRPGSLLGILQEFAARDVNLTKLESRPDQARASATTASSSTARATSPTRSSPTRCATSRPSRAR